MKERPILFSAPMVRAILDGSKTQTRRLVKIKPPLCNPPYFPTGKVLSNLPRQLGAFMEFRYQNQPSESASFLLDCPHGKPADRLWVRESFGRFDSDHIINGQRFYYAADTRPGSESDEIRKQYGYRYTPSIHMPREASRILLEVTGVCVERLQDISGEDAQAEGVQVFAGETLCHARANPITAAIYRDSFMRLWESINGAGGWNANPWVWVIKFKRADAGAMKQAA